MALPLSCILSFTLILLQIQIQSSTIVAQNTGNISVGQSLSATTNASSWLSPSGDFAFGFHPFPNNNTDLFLLAIWYAKIPDTIVWYANGGNPVPQGSTVKLTAVAGLLLSDPRGTQIWNTSDELSGVGDVTNGFMNDTGNFALKTSSTNDAVWESFDHPTDTLLPTQIMEAGGEVDSRLSETNFTQGRFQLRLLNDGNLVLNTRDLTSGYAYDPYYATGTDLTSPGYRVVYNESGYMYILRKDGSKFDLLPESKTVSAKDNYQRATLDFDGVLTWYYHARTFNGNQITGTWSKIKWLPDNICITGGGTLDTGACGYNSICSIDEDQRPSCKCPPSYSLMDPNNTYGSCLPDFKLDVCEGYGHGTNNNTMKGEYKFVPLKNTNFPFADYAKLQPYNEEDCKSSCLNDCFCVAAIFDSPTSACWKKKFPLSNGRNDSSETGTAWIKVGKDNLSNDPFINPFYPPPKVVKNKLNVVISALLGSSVFVNLVLLSAIGLGIFRIYNKKQIRHLNEGKINKSLYECSNVCCFSYKELEKATNGFKEELGRGAFGVVYKGMITVGGPPICIAVKKLDRISKDADKEFKTEVDVIGQTHHKNLVRLIGYCKEEDQRLLVYENMSNGSLAEYLFSDPRPSWVERIQIPQGIARGLMYLHDDCRTQIIHCDIKPQNILLDDYYNARISDFGLAKLLDLNQTQTQTAIRGTKGYVAPEWFRNKPVTVKVDVYSFGVLLLEIICGRKSVSLEESGEERVILTDWAFDCYQSGRLDSLVSDDTEALNDRLRLERFVKVALWCIQEDPGLRPTMKMVIMMIEGVIEVPDPTCPTSFSISTQS